jgi:6-phosphogluconolactonase (cycloisomerase 2 family)
MWIATQGDQKVRAYTINQENGSMSLVGNGGPVATGVQPVQMVITPDAKTMFIVNSGANGTAGSITAYTFNGDGTLTAAGSGTAAGETPIAAAVDPSGKFLFVANQGNSADVNSGTVSVFSVSGANLTEVTGSPFPTALVGEVSGTGPSAVAVSPVGSFLYVANQFSNTVESFTYDASGALTFINEYGAGANPSGLAFSRCAGVSSGSSTSTCAAADATNLFVANSGSNNVSVFAACIQVSATCATPNGTLAQIASGSPVSAGVGPSTILINPTSDFVYAVDRGSNQVSGFQYSPATGALTSLGVAVSGGASVFSGGITANVADNSKTFNWVVVSNNGASSVSAFRVNATGRLVALTSGPFAVQGQPSAILLR